MDITPGPDPNVTDPESAEKPPLPPESLLDRMRADPLHAAEHLALAAVERFGPEAQQWVALYKHHYPTVTEAQLAMMTRDRFIRLSRYSGAVAGVAGGFGAVVDVGVLAWNQARMVMYFAAIFGEDTTSADRAAELLLLQNVHKMMGTARTALEVAARQAPPSELLKHHRGGSLGTLALSLAKMAGMRVARRAVLKVVPLASVPLGAMANASSTRQLADRAVAMYAHRRHQRGITR
jgi:hypothetical protein